MSKVKLKKSIKLTILKPHFYRFWVFQAEAIFQVHKLLNLMLERELNSFSQIDIFNSDVIQVEAILIVTQRKDLAEWQRKHDLAYEALLTSLEPSEHLKVYRLRSANAVWSRLHDEYGQVSDLRRSQAETAWHALEKDASTSMKDHINQFTLLQQEVDYQRPGNIPELTITEINLNFVRSLGKEWRVFHQALGPRILMEMVSNRPWWGRTDLTPVSPGDF